MGAGDGFECLTPLNHTRARVRFTGRLDGEAVTWEATLVTLEEWRQAAGAGMPARQFIEVAAPRAGVAALTVCLAVPVIDLPTVRKAVIMIRNYKRLRPGRHEYGEPVSAASNQD